MSDCRYILLNSTQNILRETCKVTKICETGKNICYFLSVVQQTLVSPPPRGEFLYVDSDKNAFF